MYCGCIVLSCTTADPLEMTNCELCLCLCLLNCVCLFVVDVLCWVAPEPIHWRWQIRSVQMTPWQENSICSNHHLSQLPDQPLRPIWYIWPRCIRYLLTHSMRHTILLHRLVCSDFSLSIVLWVLFFSCRLGFLDGDISDTKRAIGDSKEREGRSQKAQRASSYKSGPSGPLYLR